MASSFSTPTLVIIPKIVTPLVGAPSVTYNQIDSNSTPFFEDDYVHSKLLAFKYKGLSSQFIVNAKANLNLVQKKGASIDDKTKEVPVTAGEVKLVTRLSDRVVVETRFDNKGTVRLWSNLGQHDFGRSIGLWAKLKSTSDFGFWSGWLQTGTSGKNFNYNGRIDRKKDGQIYLNEKLHVFQDKIHFIAVTKLGLSNFKLRRYNALLAYRTKEFDVVAQHVSNPKQEKIDIGELNVAAYYRRGIYQGGVKVVYNNQEKEGVNKVSGVIGGIAKLDDKNILKAKIDSNTFLSLSLKHKHSSNIWATIGSQIKLTDPGSYLTSRLIPVPVGVQFEFFY